MSHPIMYCDNNGEWLGECQTGLDLPACRFEYTQYFFANARLIINRFLGSVNV